MAKLCGRCGTPSHGICAECEQRIKENAAALVAQLNELALKSAELVDLLTPEGEQHARQMIEHGIEAGRFFGVK